VIAFKVVEGLTFVQIAERLGLSINTVASRYRYAIRRLRELSDDSIA
jgi:DNA-directed RNA polymerase specialized sigma24 family protein